MRVLVSVALLVLLASCTTVPSDAPAYVRAVDPPAGKANLYIYRIGARPTLRTPDILVDGVKVFAPAERSYTVIQVAKGEHTVKIDWSWDTGWPDVSAPVLIDDESAYIKISGSFEKIPLDSLKGPLYEAGSILTIVKKDPAEADIRECCRFVPAHKGG